MSNDDVKHIQQALAEPFPPDTVGWKPGAVSGERCLAMPYIDARDVMDRLDAVLGVDGWEDSYQVLPDGNVVCTLQLKLGGEWISKMDVGGESDQKDEGDKRKSAFSDALKRTAVKAGVARYLYRLGAIWADYDAQKKRIKNAPQLPDWALPGNAPPPADNRQPQQSAAPAPNGKGEKTLPDLIMLWDQKGQEAGLADGQLGDAAVEQFKDRLGDDWTTWPETARGEVVGWIKTAYADQVGPLPATAEQQKELLAALHGKGETWQKLASKLKWPRNHATNALTRAQFAAGMKALESVPTPASQDKGGKGAA